MSVLRSYLHLCSLHAPQRGQTWDLLEEPVQVAGRRGAGEQGRRWWLLALEMDTWRHSTVPAPVGLKLLQSADKTTKKTRKEGIICVNFIARAGSISRVYFSVGLELLAWF